MASAGTLSAPITRSRARLAESAIAGSTAASAASPEAAAPLAAKKGRAARRKGDGEEATAAAAEDEHHQASRGGRKSGRGKGNGQGKRKGPEESETEADREVVEEKKVKEEEPVTKKSRTRKPSAAPTTTQQAARKTKSSKEEEEGEGGEAERKRARRESKGGEKERGAHPDGGSTHPDDRANEHEQAIVAADAKRRSSRLSKASPAAAADDDFRNPPVEMFEAIFLQLDRVKDVLALAATCHNAWAAFCGLPAWFPHFLKHAGVLRETPILSVRRALRIINTRRCELCGGTRVKGFDETFHVFAHATCLSEHMVSEKRYRDKTMLEFAAELQIPRSKAASGSWIYWEKPVPGIIEPAETLEGLRDMTESDALISLKTLREQRQATKHAITSRQAAIYARNLARLRRDIEAQWELAERKRKATEERTELLEVRLAEEGLPSIAELRTRGPFRIADAAYLCAYLDVRVTCPYSVEQALVRVRSFLTACEEEEERTARRQRVRKALSKVGKYLVSVEMTSRLSDAFNVDGLLHLLKSGDKRRPLTDEHIQKGVEALLAFEKKERDELEAEQAERVRRVSAALEAVGLPPVGSLERELSEYLDKELPQMKDARRATASTPLEDAQIAAAVKLVKDFHDLIQERITALTERVAAAKSSKVVTRESIRNSCLCDKIFTTNPQAQVSQLALKKYLSGAVQYTITCSRCGELGAQLCTKELCLHCCRDLSCVRHHKSAFTYFHNKSWNQPSRSFNNHGGWVFGQGYY